jgi:hypothetical protein
VSADCAHPFDGITEARIIMPSLADVKKEIEQLSPKQRKALLAWLQEEKESQWDARIESDAKSGKLKNLMDEAKSDYKAGRCRELP